MNQPFVFGGVFTPAKLFLVLADLLIFQTHLESVVRDLECGLPIPSVYDISYLYWSQINLPNMWDGCWYSYSKDKTMSDTIHLYWNLTLYKCTHKAYHKLTGCGCREMHMTRREGLIISRNSKRPNFTHLGVNHPHGWIILKTHPLWSTRLPCWLYQTPH